MEGTNSQSAGLQVKEGYQAMKAIEGTAQCPGCRRFMRLGKGRLCLTTSGEDLEIAEIVGWVPGVCDRYQKDEGPLYG